MCDLKLVKIDKTEFLRLSNCDEVYVCNGCVFEIETDNLISFPFYETDSKVPSFYFKFMRCF